MPRQRLLRQPSASMSQLNRQAAEAFSGLTVNACTDVTGFGLTGHLKEMIAGSDTDAELFCGKIPLLEQAAEYADAGMIPGGSLNNLDFASDVLDWDKGIGNTLKKILADAQTSGGLLAAIPAGDAEKYLARLTSANIQNAAIIGRIVEGTGRIRCLA